MVTQEEFKKYLEIQQSGATNMYDTAKVTELSAGVLDRDKCIEIMANYAVLKIKYRKLFKPEGKMRKHKLELSAAELLIIRSALQELKLKFVELDAPVSLIVCKELIEKVNKSLND